MENRNKTSLKRIVRFGDIDSAGVIHFHNLFRWCHEAWEENMGYYGVKPLDIFPSSAQEESNVSIALPIVHCEADFFSPILIGDELSILLLPTHLNAGSFQVQYKFQRGGQNVSDALLKHRSINSINRKPCNLPSIIVRWIEENNYNMHS